MLIDETEQLTEFSFSDYFYQKYAEQNSISIQQAHLLCNSFRYDKKAIELVQLLGSYASSAQYSKISIIEIDQKIDPYVEVHLNIDSEYNYSECVTAKPNIFYNNIDEILKNSTLTSDQKIDNINKLMHIINAYNDGELIKIIQPEGTIKLQNGLHHCQKCKIPFTQHQDIKGSFFLCRECHKKK